MALTSQQMVNWTRNFISYARARQEAGKPVLVSSNDFEILEQIQAVFEERAND